MNLTMKPAAPESRLLRVGEDRGARASLLREVLSHATNKAMNLNVEINLMLGTAPEGDRQLVEILVAVLTDGLTAVEIACAEALKEGVHSRDVILNILARQRDPGLPATIVTPEARRMRHEPAADCARIETTGCSIAWRKKYAGLMPSEMRRLRQLEEESGKLKKLVADLAWTRQCCRTC